MSSDSVFGHRDDAPASDAAPDIVTSATAPAAGWWNKPISTTAICFIVIGFLLSAGDVWFSVTQTQNTIARNTALQTRGVETTGAVVGFFTTSTGGRHSTTRLNVRYTYDVPTQDGGQTRYQASSTIPDNAYAQIANERTVPVIYDPQQPSVVLTNMGDWIHRWTKDSAWQGSMTMTGLTVLLIWVTVGAIYVRLGRLLRRATA